MKDKIRDCLTQLGIGDIGDDDALLVDYGFDSLSLVLMVIEIEKQLHIKVPGTMATEENFKSITQIEKMLIKLGAK